MRNLFKKTNDLETNGNVQEIKSKKLKKIFNLKRGKSLSTTSTEERSKIIEQIKLNTTLNKEMLDGYVLLLTYPEDIAAFNENSNSIIEIDNLANGVVEKYSDVI